MKQKIVIKVPMNGHKSRSKVMKTAVSVQGVESVALKGQDMNQIEVTGEGIDPVGLTELLRKNLGHAELGLCSYLRENGQYARLLTVATVEEKKDDGGDSGEKKREIIEPYYPPIYYPRGYPYIV